MREQREHNQNNLQLEQFRGYKRMIHQNQKQLKQVSIHSVLTNFVLNFV